MNFQLYLDPNEDAPVPDGLRVVQSEVALLELLNRPEASVIRGNELCRWVQDYARSRGISVCLLSSPTNGLRQLCPELSLEQAQELAGRIGIRLSGRQDLTLAQLAHWLWGELWWSDEPGPRHAAFWLQWWLDHQPSKAEQVLLAALSKSYGSAYSGVESAAYTVNSADAAFELLRGWLGLSQPLGWGKFPVELSKTLSLRLHEEFRGRVLQDQKELVSTLLANGADMRLLPIAAEVSASYYIAQPERVTPEVIAVVEGHVNGASREKLRRLLPPPLPSPVPSDASQLGRWFVREYLPYREWASNHPDHDATALGIGRTFAEEYLRLYSNDALSDGPARQYLSWVKARQLRQPDTITLMVVLDGLGYTDMQHLWEEIRRFDVSKRISLIQADVAFAPLPTITECAKPALLKGVKPALVREQPDLGRVLSKDEDVRRALAEAALGDLIIWKDQEPDSTYHDAAGKDVALKNARGILTGFAQRLTELVLNLPAAIPLRVVVTTDHGRLMAEAPRVHPLPEGTQSRQRAALGDLELRVGLKIEGDIAYLHRNTYGLSQDCAVVLSGESFLTQDGKRGVDAYPHGGIFPEEVLIPWWVLIRDHELHELEAEIHGKGVAGRSGQLVLELKNPNPILLEVVSLNLTALQPQTFTLHEVLPPMGVVERLLDLPSWPTLHELQNLMAQISYRLPDQRLVYARVKVHLEVEEMYQQSDNPLEDLL